MSSNADKSQKREPIKPISNWKNVKRYPNFWIHWCKKHIWFCPHDCDFWTRSWRFLSSIFCEYYGIFGLIYLFAKMSNFQNPTNLPALLWRTRAIVLQAIAPPLLASKTASNRQRRCRHRPAMSPSFDCNIVPSCVGRARLRSPWRTSFGSFDWTTWLPVVDLGFRQRGAFAKRKWRL